MDQVLYDFNKFDTEIEEENFIKDLIKKQVDLSAHLVEIYSDNPSLNAHYLLLLNTQNSNFHKILFPSLTTQSTIDHFAENLAIVAVASFCMF